MIRLLQMLGWLDQNDMFRNQDELIADACVIQEQRIAYADEEAGGAASV